MTPELTYLAYAVILLIVHMVIQACSSTLSRGLGYAVSNRDDQTQANLTTQRLERGLTNYVYNLPAFIALALMLKVTDLATNTTALGAAIWFWACVAYIPAYAFGMALLRPVTWVVSLIGLGMMITPLLST